MDYRNVPQFPLYQPSMPQFSLSQLASEPTELELEPADDYAMSLPGNKTQTHQGSSTCFSTGPGIDFNFAPNQQIAHCNWLQPPSMLGAIRGADALDGTTLSVRTVDDTGAPPHCQSEDTPNMLPMYDNGPDNGPLMLDGIGECFPKLNDKQQLYPADFITFAGPPLSDHHLARPRPGPSRDGPWNSHEAAQALPVVPLGPQLFFCNACGKALGSLRTLKRHIDKIHECKSYFVCKCGKTDVRKDNFTRHWKTCAHKQHQPTDVIICICQVFKTDSFEAFQHHCKSSCTYPVHRRGRRPAHPLNGLLG